jgi:protein TonB
VVQPVKSVTFKVPKVVEDNLATTTPPKIADFEDAVAAQTTNKTGASGSAVPTVIAATKGGAAIVMAPMVEEEIKEDKTIFIATEVRAEFPGGERAMMQWLADNIRYPTMAREVGLEGKVFLSFVVEKNGSITDIKVRRGIGSGCDEAAKNAIEQMPKWSPAKQNGRAVRVQFTLPVQFHLD